VGAAGGCLVTRPLPEFERSTRVGLVDVSRSPDGLVRGMVHADQFGGVAYASIASQLGGSVRIRGRVEYPIDFAISPNAFKHVSYLDVLDGATDMLAGKTVFVGATALELGDNGTGAGAPCVTRCGNPGHCVCDAARRQSDVAAALADGRRPDAGLLRYPAAATLYVA
jgi:CHASE2 domain-containing sensor protein